jgi:hypothetical protein
MGEGVRLRAFTAGNVGALSMAYKPLSSFS